MLHTAMDTIRKSVQQVVPMMTPQNYGVPL